METSIPTAVNSAQVLLGVAHWKRKQHTNCRSEGFLQMQAKRGDSGINCTSCVIWVFGFPRSNPRAAGPSHRVSVRWFLIELHRFIMLVLDMQEFAPCLETQQGGALEKLLEIFKPSCAFALVCPKVFACFWVLPGIILPAQLANVSVNTFFLKTFIWGEEKSKNTPHLHQNEWC